MAGNRHDDVHARGRERDDIVLDIIRTARTVFSLTVDQCYALEIEMRARWGGKRPYVPKNMNKRRRRREQEAPAATATGPG